MLLLMTMVLTKSNKQNNPNVVACIVKSIKHFQEQETNQQLKMEDNAQDNQEPSYSMFNASVGFCCVPLMTNSPPSPHNNPSDDGSLFLASGQARNIDPVSKKVVFNQALYQVTLVIMYNMDRSQAENLAAANFFMI